MTSLNGNAFNCWQYPRRRLKGLKHGMDNYLNLRNLLFWTLILLVGYVQADLRVSPLASQLSGTLDSSVSLVCSSSSKPILCLWKTPYGHVYTLSKGVFAESGRLRHKDEGDEAHECGLEIVGLEKQDLGSWECEVGALIGDTFETATANIQLSEVKRSSPTFHEGQTSRQEVGDDVILHCSADREVHLCRWKTPYLNTYIVGEGIYVERGRIQWLGKDPNFDCTIRVANLDLRDAGTWVCEIGSSTKESFQVQTKEFVIDIETPLKLSAPTALMQNANTAATLVCHANKPYDVCLWTTPYGETYSFPDPNTSHENGRITYFGFADTDCGVIVRNVQPKDSGGWQCQLHSRNGEIFQNATDVVSLFAEGRDGNNPLIAQPRSIADYDYNLNTESSQDYDYFDRVRGEAAVQRPTTLQLIPSSNSKGVEKTPTRLSEATPSGLPPPFELSKIQPTEQTTSSAAPLSILHQQNDQQNKEFAISNPLELELLSRISGTRRDSRPVRIGSESRDRGGSSSSRLQPPLQSTSDLISSSVFESTKTTTSSTTTATKSTTTTSKDDMRQLEIQRIRDERRKAAQEREKERLEKEKKDEQEEQQRRQLVIERKRLEERRRKMDEQRRIEAEELEKKQKEEEEKKKKEEEERKQKEEEERQRKLREERERKRKEDQERARKREEERQRKIQAERQRKREEERRRKMEEERQRKIEEERKAKEEEERKMKEEEERKKKEEEEKKKKEEEERKAQEELERKRKAEAEERKRRREEQRRKRIQEQMRRKAEEQERRRKAEEEALKRKEEEERKMKEEEERKQKEEEERQRKIAEEKAAKEEEERRKEVQRRREEARRQREEELKKQREEEKRRQELEEQRKLEEEQRRKALEEQRIKDEEAKKQAEAREAELKRRLALEKKRKEDEERRLAELERQRQEKIKKEREELERQRKEEEDKLRREIERKKKEEEEQRKLEEERKRKEDEEVARKFEEARKREEEEKRKLEELKRQEERNRRIEIQRQRDEQERQRKLEAEKQRNEEEEKQKRLEAEQAKADERKRVREERRKQREEERRAALERVRQDRIKDEQEEARKKQQAEQRDRQREEDRQRRIEEDRERRREEQRRNFAEEVQSQPKPSNRPDFDPTSLIPRTESPRSFPSINLPNTGVEDGDRKRCYVSVIVSNGNITCENNVPDAFGEYSIGHGEKCELYCKSGYVSIFRKEGVCQDGRLTPRLNCVRPDALLLLTGRSATHGVLNTVELVTNRGVCRGAVPPLPAMRWRMIAESIDKEHVLACGGVNIFGDPKKNCWILGFRPEPYWSPTNDMIIARDAAAWALEGNFLIVLGGSLGKLNGYTDSVEMHNVKTQEWIEGPPMSSSRYSHCAVGLGNGSIIVTGGYGGLGATERLDLDTGKWWPLPELNPVRAQHGCAMVDLNGEQGVLVVGGDSGGTRLKDVRFLPLDRPEKGWQKVADLNTARWGRPGVAMVGGRITVAAGWDGVRDLDTVEYYDEKLQRWRLTASRLQFERRWPASTPISLSLFPKCAQKRE